MEQQLELERAAAALPCADDDSWSIPQATLEAAGLVDDVASARKFVLAFSQWARDAVKRLPHALPADMEATDFNDYYKIVMSRVQFLYAQAVSGAPFGSAVELPLCCFQTQIRRRPTFTVGGAKAVSGVFDVRGSFQSSVRIEGCLEESREAFRTALAAVGSRPFRAATLALLVKSVSAPAAAIEASLAPLTDDWIRALDGQRLFTLLPEGAPFSEGEDVEVRLVQEGGGVVLLAQGPWFRVTFCETPLLQAMSQFYTQSLCGAGDDDGVAWCREAMLNFATVSHQVHRRCAARSFALFAGRRTPHPQFHLLQHLYLSEALGGMATSSLFAARVLGPAGTPQALIGTLAHEGPMAAMGLHPELDGTLPLSSLLWHTLFWAATANYTVLPDGHGSAAFAAMLTDLGLFQEVKVARQDSGHLERFARLFSSATIMASEIEVFADVERALACGYSLFGAGGFFGEKRRVQGPEFSLAAKITKTLRTPRPGESAAAGTLIAGYAAKLGDCTSNEPGSWAQADPAAAAPAKFIVSPEANRDAMWGTMLGYAVSGDAWFDAKLAGGAPGPLVPSADAAALAAMLRALSASPALTAGACDGMRGRLLKLASTIDAAAAALAP